MRLGMVIDMKNCIACNACAVACKVENNIPDNVWWNRILTEGGEYRDTPSGTYPKDGATSDLHMDNYPLACQHCENPACVCASSWTTSSKKSSYRTARHRKRWLRS